jgi:hypothetical protein
MRRSYERRPEDFKRRILKRIMTNRVDLLAEENRWLGMIKPTEIKPTNPKPRYFNLYLRTGKRWHTDEESRKTVGQKISAAKLGKNTGSRDPSVGAAISAAKKGKKFTDAHRAALRQAKLGTKRSEEAKRKTSESLRRAWAEGRHT